jgi:hypothetical protein
MAPSLPLRRFPSAFFFTVANAIPLRSPCDFSFSTAEPGDRQPVINLAIGILVADPAIAAVSASTSGRQP